MIVNNKKDRSINPLGNLYDSFITILKNTTIKYVCKAEEYETVDTKLAADGYIDALSKKDTFYSYIDYTKNELMNAGITNADIINEALLGNTREIPSRYHESLLEQRRARCIRTFEEKNNYYRMLNGYPDVEDTDYVYVPETLFGEYGIDTSIPIHLIQDYYNNQSAGLGDYYMSLFEGFGYISEVKEKYPEKKYLDFLGSRRISISTARTAKNFQIIRIYKGDVKDSLFNEFIRVYDACREYFVTTIYVYHYHTFFERYDNLIAMSIMFMTIQQIVMRQLSSFVDRNFFDIYAVKMLYEAYDIPYDLSIDEETQNQLIKNLNLLVQKKATDKVIYDIANLLGFSNINVYRYFLAKERKFDAYGVPIVKWTQKFNSETGEVSNVLDTEAMYDLYFQRSEMREKDFINSFKDPTNHIKYEDVTSGDPFWVEDQNLYNRIWEPQYNYVESKYLGLGISYSITDIMFENILFIKLLMQKSNDLRDLFIKIPKILSDVDVPIFDIVIALICLTACKHNLYGEIISVPTQVISVLDYLKQKEHADLNLDTLKFNFNYFFNPDEEDKNDKVYEMQQQLSAHMRNLDKSNFLVDTFQFNFDYFDKRKPDTKEKLDKLKSAMSEDDYYKFRKYIDVIMQDTSSVIDKAKAINDIYANIKSLKTLLNYYLTKICDNRREYENIKTLYDALFYSQEMSSIFTITGERTGFKRTAFTYFEFLYHKNPKLYSALFEIDMEEEYAKYLVSSGKSSDEYSYDDFIEDVEYGNIFIDYSSFIGSKQAEEEGDKEYKENKLYYFINHIIGRMQLLIDNIELLYMMNDSQTPLQTLLMRLIRFFKSYTVDIIDLDIIFVCDQKPENCIRLFDEIYDMQKLIQDREDLRISYGDVIHLMVSNMELGKDTESIRLKDQCLYDAWMWITIHDSIYKQFPNLLRINLHDGVDITSKEIEVEEPEERLFDAARINSTINLNESCKLQDKIVKMWYD